MFSRAKPLKPEELAKLRQKQILELERIVPGARPVDVQKSAYDVAVANQFGRLIMRIYLDATFPEKAPTVQVMNRITHKWVDNQMMVVGFEKLINWTSNSNLGKVIEELMKEFAANPPMPQTIGQPISVVAAAPNQPFIFLSNGQPMIQPSLSASAAALATFMSPAVQAPAAKDSKQNKPAAKRQPLSIKGSLPQVPDTFPILDAFSTDDLQLLLDDEVTLEEMVDNMEGVRSAAELRDNTAQEVETMAKTNLSQRDELTKLQSEVTELISKLSALEKEHAGLSQRRTNVLNYYGASNLTGMLSKAIDTADEESEGMKSKYHRESSLPEEAHAKFYDEFLAKRIVYHLRCARKERLAEAASSGLVKG